MTQEWYVQYDDRTAGPLSARQLHSLSKAGELKPDDRVSLDGRSWFRASKVLGLFPDPAAVAMVTPRVAEEELDFEAADEAIDTRVFDPSSSSVDDRPAVVDEAVTRIDGAVDRLPGGAGEKTRIETFAGSIVDDGRPGSARGPVLALSRSVAVSALRFGWWAIRATAIVAILLVAWSLRAGIGLIRRRRVARTGIESKLSARLRGRAGSAGPAGSTSSGPLSGTFGRYEILRTLGKGGMGTVYLATDTQLGRQVALKVPHFSAEDGPGVLERFDREARAAAMLDHPNVCPIFDVGTINGTPYASMAYIEGRPLADLVDVDKRLAERESAVLVRKVALAMAEAHHKGIIHRDLKPANIMINPRREPVIMDFGLARRPGTGDSKLTKDGAIVGTPSYMSPEQAGGNPDDVGPPSDIYSLGVVLYELLTGRLPFEGPVIAVLGQLLSAEPAPPSVHRPEVDHQLEAICRKAIAKKPGDRFPTMVDYSKALTRYLKAHPPEEGVDDGEDVASWSEFFALPPRQAEGVGTTSPADRHHWPLRALAASIVLLAGAVGYLAWHYPGTMPNLVSSTSNTSNTFQVTQVSQTTVNVTLLNYQVAQTTVNVSYYLDGKPIDAADLTRPMPLLTGEHAVEARRPDGQSQTWAFAVGRGDDQKSVDVRRAPAEASEDAKTQIDGLLDEDPGVRKLAAEQLGRMNDPTTIPALINRVADDRWYDSGFTNVPSDPEGGGKDAALAALRKLAPERVLVALARASRSPDGRVRLWSLETLAGDRANASKPEVVRVVAAMLKDEDADIWRAKNDKNLRRLAAECLLAWGATSAAPDLEERVADDLWFDSGYTNVPSDPEGGGKAASLEALRKLAPGRVKAALQRARTSKTAGVRKWALSELGPKP